MVDARPARTIAKLGTTFVDLFNAGDIQLLVEAVYADNGRMLAPNSPMVQGKDTAGEVLRAGRATGFGQVSASTNEISCTGEMAYCGNVRPRESRAGP